ncbi:MAG: Laminin sub domain 2, partial [Labilithrix sp.]|nr:Laminin sub domain 2 [Labilithrix sp.]
PPGAGDAGGGGVADGGDAGADGATTCEDRVLAFDGTDDAASVPDSPALDLPDDFTVEAWIKPGARATTDAEQAIVSHHDGNASRGWALLVKSGRVEIVVYGDTAFVPIAFSAGNSGAAYVVPGTWAHVAGTLQGKTLRIYYDGVQRDTQQLDALFGRDGYDGAMRFGRMASSAEHPYEGQLDDVRLSKIARYLGPTAPIPDEPLAVDGDTVASFHLDEHAGLVLEDGTHAHDGVLPTDGTAPARVVTPCIGFR